MASWECFYHHQQFKRYLRKREAHFSTPIRVYNENELIQQQYLPV